MPLYLNLNGLLLSIIDEAISRYIKNLDDHLKLIEKSSVNH